MARRKLAFVRAVHRERVLWPLGHDAICFSDLSLPQKGNRREATKSLRLGQIDKYFFVYLPSYKHITDMKLAKLSFLVAVAALALASCAAPKQDNAQTVLDTIFARKSVRSYTDQDVTPEQVETLLKAAMSAPTGMNLQPWRFVVVRDQEVKDKLAGPRGGMIASAPVVIVVCGETTWTHKPFGQPDAEEVSEPNGNWTADCAAATENLLIAVQAMGLGAVWTAGYPYPERIATIREALGLPESVSPYCVVPVGYPAGDDQPKDKWKPENIHYDRW